MSIRIVFSAGFLLVLNVKTLTVCLLMFVLSSTICLAAANTPSKSSNSQMKALIAKGAALDAKSQYVEAINIFNKAITLCPQDPVGYYWRGLSSFHFARYESAIADFGKAIDLRPEYQDAYFMRGKTLCEIGLCEKAISDFEWVAKKDPQFKEAYDGIEKASEKLGKQELLNSAREKASHLQRRLKVADGEPAIPDFRFISSRMKKAIRPNWKPPERRVTKGVWIKFEVHRNQQITDIKVKSSSGDSIFDKAALKAIRSTPSVGPLPPGSSESETVTLLVYQNFLDWPGVLHKAVNNPGLRTASCSRLKKAHFLAAKQKYSEAIPIYLEALELYKKRGKGDDCIYKIREICESLGDSYASAGDQKMDNAKDHARYLRKSLYYSPGDKKVEERLNSAIRQLQRDPTSEKDRELLGDEAIQSGEFCEADIEYQASLGLKESKSVRDKLEALREAHGTSPANM